MPTTKIQSERPLDIIAKGKPSFSNLSKKELKVFIATLEAEIRIYYSNLTIEENKKPP